MGAGQLGTHDRESRASFECSSHGADRFGDNPVRAPVEKSEGLGIAFHWHGGHHAAGLCFGDHDAELVVQGASGQFREVHGFTLGDNDSPYDA